MDNIPTMNNLKNVLNALSGAIHDFFVDNPEKSCDDICISYYFNKPNNNIIRSSMGFNNVDHVIDEVHSIIHVFGDVIVEVRAMVGNKPSHICKINCSTDINNE